MRTSKYEHLAQVERVKETIERDLLYLEQISHKSGLVYIKLIAHFNDLEEIYKKEKSWYLLERTRRLKALLKKRQHDLGYNEKDFTIFFKWLESVVDFSKDALISPLIIPNL